MANEVNMAKARQVYNSIVTMLNERDWKFDQFDDDLVIRSGIKGDDLPIEFLLIVNAKNQVIQFISKLPFTVPDDKRVDAAIAVCVANYGLVDGSFDFDISDGELRYRLTCSYRDSDLSPNLFEYIIMCAASTVDQYNDKFFMLCKGMITVQQFIEQDGN